MDDVDILLLIGELEGCCSHTKRLGLNEDWVTLREMCDRYYKLYFKLKRSSRDLKPGA